MVSDCPHSQTGLQLAKGFRPCYPSGTWSQKIRSHKLTVIFGRQITKQYSGKLQTEIEDLHLGNPVIRSYYKNGFAKHYVRDHDVLRFEAASNDVKGDYGINQAVENLVRLRENLQGITERYQNVQQDILETFWIEESSESWRNQLCSPMAGAFPHSNWTMPANWPW